MSTKYTYTLAELLVMDYTALNTLAAERVMGWKFITVDNWYWYWQNKAGSRAYSAEPLDTDYFNPAQRRDHSGELLEELAKRGCGFLVAINGLSDDDIEVSIPNHHGYCIPGNDARSEASAAILAAQAMEETNG